MLYLGAVGLGKGVVAERDVHFLEHPVFVEAGGGVHFGTAKGAPDERPAAFALEVREALIESGVAKLGPGVEAGEAVTNLDKGSLKFAPGGCRVEFVSTRPKPIAGNVDVWRRNGH